MYVFFQLCLSSVSFTIPICPAVYENPQTNIDKESIRIICLAIACEKMSKKKERKSCTADGPRIAASNLRRTCFDTIDRFAMATS